VRVTVKTEGFKELEQALSILPRVTQKNTAKRTLLQAAEPIASKAQQLAPDDFRTGPPDLHTSIKATVRPRSRRTVWVDVAPFASIERNPKTHKFTGRRVAAAKLERGDSNTPAHPFMRPAFEAEKGHALATIKSLLRVEILKSVARLAKKGKL
jgi:HK97 gp10 family phage protein